MKVGSLFSGIGAPEHAWRPLGFDFRWCAEISAFPSAVLRHHYPDMPNLGDVMKVDWDAAEPIDLLVGGPPCQDFSIAGRRAGLDGARGNMAVEFFRIAGRLRPRWVVFENVPGLLSMDGGLAFGTLLRLLGECGYGFAYRVLDARYSGVPQRRRRVFVVGYLGDWRPAAAVLLDRQSLRGDPAPGRQTGEDVARTITGGAPDGGPAHGARSASAKEGNLIAGTPGANHGNIKAEHAWTGQLAYGGNNTSGPVDVATACNALGGPHGRLDFESETFVAHSLRAEGSDASEDDTGRGVPLVVNARQDPDCSPIALPLDTNGHSQAVAFAENGRAGLRFEGGEAYASQVRRLVPEEAEALMGFPRGYTAIPWRGGTAPDGPRYKALGNSMCVPDLAWLGRRIALIDGKTPCH